MFRDLRTQLLVWTLLPLTVILVGVAYLGVNSHQNAMRDMVYNRDAALAHVVASQWTGSLASHATLLPTLDPVQSTCDTACAAFDGGIALYDPPDTLVRGQPSADIWAPRRARVAALIGNGNSRFASPFLENGKTVILVASVRADGYLVGAFTAPSLTGLGFGEMGTAYVVDQSGEIVADADPSQIGLDLAKEAEISDVLQGRSGATYRTDAAGNELVIGYAPIAGTGWGLVIEEPWAAVVEPMFQYSVLLPLVFLVVAIVALGAIYFGIRNVVRPLQRLVQVAGRIAYGDYAAASRTVGGIHEIEELRETLDGMAQQVHVSHNAMQSYITAITRGQEDERMRLARELHDDTIQSLIALQQRVELTQKVITRDTTLANERLTELKTLVGDTLASVRRFVRDLRPTYLAELGLIPALDSLTREAGASFVVRGNEVRLDAERELVLFRIVQEALRNVGKHARASQVSVTLSFDEREVTATIRDDGVGFDAPEAPTDFVHAGHFGLMGMHERAQLFGGNVYVKSAPGKGTSVIVYVPTRT
ncbi:MAG: histidine kinase [Chloroflexi bacterium]|nr:histidine kinase [Chloroflexota bacterium]